MAGPPDVAEALVTLWRLGLLTEDAPASGLPSRVVSQYAGDGRGVSHTRLRQALVCETPARSRYPEGGWCLLLHAPDRCDDCDEVEFFDPYAYAPRPCWDGPVVPTLDRYIRYIDGWASWCSHVRCTPTGGIAEAGRTGWRPHLWFTWDDARPLERGGLCERLVLAIWTERAGRWRFGWCWDAETGGVLYAEPPPARQILTPPGTISLDFPPTYLAAKALLGVDVSSDLQPVGGRCRG